ncbi:winged helix-turn-helix domain-containing protein [Erwinia piriflorinigrans]|uniref:OmpR/PhoB-type domain-containing protein n=1 Tax=Erwinia piriflorinigrans CFBP 5888 TaxID=1161919 RepID=V5ZA55_9GAMM|nr:winged helix-turn-helix domain-containing protein [Erwinia piriflorinigrans]CCG88115.1 putative protein yqeI [Erwinia piriflorinigrans CFBP 5888]
MDNNIIIGNLLTIDRRTRTLSSVLDGKNVMLPASACRCLIALTQAKEQVLSQEQLMDIGWRHSGVEVTDNSVRVMITKIRRALIALEVNDSVQLIAVTRSGYRLIVRTEQPAAELRNVSAGKPLHVSAEVISQHVGAFRAHSQLIRRMVASAAGLVVGSCVVAAVSWLLTIKPEPINYIRWHGEEAPPQTEVWVPGNIPADKQLIAQTLQLYIQYATKKDGDINPKHARYLYITTEESSPELGLIACVAPLRDSENNCESYSFKYR